jgi:hypothetical protein
MKNGNINLIDLDFEYKLWKERLALFIREVETLRHRNEELKHEPNHPMLNSVELMVLDDHQDLLEKLHKRIVTQEQELQFYNKDFPITSNHQYYKEHVSLQRRMQEMTQTHLDKVADVVKELGI